MLRLDPTDPRKTKVQTRDGREAEIYAVKEGQEQPIIGACKCDGQWYPFVWGSDGSFFLKHCALGSANDLVNAPEPPVTEERWACLKPDGCISVYSNCPSAMHIESCKFTAIQRLTISVTPGKFDL